MLMVSRKSFVLIKILGLEEKVSDGFDFKRLLQDCCYLHADINNKEHPKIHLKFGGSVTGKTHQSIYSETLLLEKSDNVEYKISGFDSNDIPAFKIEEYGERVDSITSLDLLSIVIPFAIADVICDTSFHEAHLAQNVTAFGATGKQEVLRFKEKFLGPQKLIEKPAYRLSDPFYVNLNERKVTFGFECLIEKYEGEGIDYVYLDENLKVKQIDTVRKTGKYSD